MSALFQKMDQLPTKMPKTLKKNADLFKHLIYTCTLQLQFLHSSVKNKNIKIVQNGMIQATLDLRNFPYATNLKGHP